MTQTITSVFQLSGVYRNFGSNEPFQKFIFGEAADLSRIPDARYFALPYSPESLLKSLTTAFSYCFDKRANQQQDGSSRNVLHHAALYLGNTGELAAYQAQHNKTTVGSNERTKLEAVGFPFSGVVITNTDLEPINKDERSIADDVVVSLLNAIVGFSYGGFHEAYAQRVAHIISDKPKPSDFELMQTLGIKLSA